jgi:hypothetical protein
MIEGGQDYLSRLRRDYHASPAALMIIVPILLATRPFDPFRLGDEDEYFDAVNVASLHWGGSADVAALISRRFGWAFASAGKLTQQTFGGPPRGYGGQETRAMSLADRVFHRNCSEVTELLCNPIISGRRRVSSLDEPFVTLDVIKKLAARGRTDYETSRVPLIMLRISYNRIKFTAGRRALARPGGGVIGDELAVADFHRLVALQDELTHAVEAVRDRPCVVMSIPESTADYDDIERDTTDQDFDAFVVASEELAARLTALKEA